MVIVVAANQTCGLPNSQVESFAFFAMNTSLLARLITLASYVIGMALDREKASMRPSMMIAFLAVLS